MLIVTDAAVIFDGAGSKSVHLPNMIVTDSLLLAVSWAAREAIIPWHCDDCNDGES